MALAQTPSLGGVVRKRTLVPVLTLWLLPAGPAAAGTSEVTTWHWRIRG
jgi:hypothetical protein